ncbi:HrpT family type III secretion system protein [Vibrio eleionomae]|uniref:HrpT family type III secretion system protein n=1 Tax=Vibrio eleionomae TaxID=2653505 RepID=UPI001368AC6E|nr:HrpT family type III secretion system protein [Vibrio eleionomae]
MKFRILCIAVITLLAGCTAKITSHQCLSNHCDRDMSSPTQLVIWWGPALRDKVNKDDDTTTYDLGKYD